nr:flagellar basal body distal rod protein [Caulobacter vibrioides]
MQALRTAASGMAAQQLNVEVISNNIANMNTVGFKRQRAEFQDLLYQTIERAGSQSSSDGNIVPTGVQVGGGVKAGSVYRITEQGTPTLTDSPLDLAIQGKGYMPILLPSGETAYTRAGNFSTNDQGQIVTEDGYLVQPGITIPQNATDITISKSGLVQVKLDGQPQPQTVGQIQLANFLNEGGLEAIGDNLFLETAASGAATLVRRASRALACCCSTDTEASNVDAVSEITALITAQRAYEMNSKVISTADQMLQATSQLRS